MWGGVVGGVGGGGGGVGGGATSPVWPAGPGYFHRGHSFQGTIWQLSFKDIGSIFKVFLS